jgi:hypothetical protein
VPTAKVSLTLDEDVVAAARRLAGPHGLSALVNEALVARLQRDRLETLLADLAAEHGDISEAELAAAVAERARLD